MKQAPVFPPPRDDDPTPWQGDTLLGYVVPRVLELTYTSHDLKGWAEDLGHTGPPFAWDPPRRRQLQAELDALFFHLYQLNREQVEWVLDSFRVLREKEEKSPEKGGFSEFLTKRLVMEAWDAMDYAIRMQKRFEPPWVSEEHRLQRMLIGENLYIEYKQNIKKNLKEGAKNNTRDSWLKAVAGFANREGGTILIGVAEDENQRGVPVGYEEKYREDPDGAVQAVVQITEVVLGGYAASLLDVEARTIDDAPVLEVTVRRGAEPIWADLFGKGPKIYVRQPNRVGVLKGEELIKYARERWGEEVAKGLHD